MKFKDKREHQYFFDFVCEGCGSEGEIGVPIEYAYKQIACPEECGAVYIMWFPTDAMPDLKCVICPVFEDERRDDRAL